MANIKFSQFTEKTTLGTVDFLVGYTGAENVQISPTNLLSTFVSGSGTAGQVAYFDPSNNLAGENDFFWDYTNNRLGIGTISPDRKLEVEGSGEGEMCITGTTGSRLFFRPTSSYSPGGNFGILVSGAGAPEYLSTMSFTGYGSGVNTVMTLKGDGKVGIGTASPVAKLQVEGSFISSGISQLGSGGSNVYLTSSSAGNVGIGTSSPANKLEVAGGGVRAPYFTSIGGRSFKMDNVAFVGGYSDGSDANAANDLGSATNQWKDLYLSGDITSSAGGATFAGNVLLGGNDDYIAFNTSGSGSDPKIKMNSDASFTFLNTAGSASLTLDNSGNATFAGNVTATNILTVAGAATGSPYLQFTQGGTQKAYIQYADSGDSFYLQSDNNFVVLTGGSTAALTLNSSQNASFAGNVLLVGNDDYISFNTSGSGSDPKIKMNSDASFTFLNTAGSASLTLDNSGNATFAGSVIAGGGTPQGASGSILKLSTSSGNTRVSVTSEATSILDFGNQADFDNGGILYDNVNKDMTFKTSANERMRITSSGNVGIGTTSPARPLDVNGSARLSDGSSLEWGGTSANIAGSSSSDTLFFRTASTERARIDSSGNVGIGTNTPSRKLAVSSSGVIADFLSSTTSSYVDIIGTTAQLRSGVFGGVVGIANGTGTTAHLAIDSSGNVGIGTTSPASKLEVDGGDIEVDDSASGLILRSPDGTRYRVTVANGGTLSVSAV